MIVLGRIVAPFGVRGWLRIHPFGDDPLTWRKMPQWWLSPDDGAAPEAWRTYELDEIKQHGDGVVAKLIGVDDRNGAEAIEGCFIAAPRDALPQTANEEFYWTDLIGLDVVNLQDQALGRVVKLLETGANDVLVVNDGEHERLLPFVEGVVKKVDIAARRIAVDWGLDW